MYIPEPSVVTDPWGVLLKLYSKPILTPGVYLKCIEKLLLFVLLMDTLSKYLFKFCIYTLKLALSSTPLKLRNWGIPVLHIFTSQLCIHLVSLTHTSWCSGCWLIDSLSSPICKIYQAGMPRSSNMFLSLTPLWLIWCGILESSMLWCCFMCTVSLTMAVT